mgnify:CR=1 FL=1
MSHLDAMEIAHATVRIPPYHGGGHREIVRQPRIYAFDTGLVAHVNGWAQIRDTDRGHLWVNLVLDELRFAYRSTTIHYWRTKARQEIDFVIEQPDGRVDAVEAKINPNAFDAAALRTFRSMHPDGNNYLVCPYVKVPYPIRKGDLTVQVCSPHQLPGNG